MADSRVGAGSLRLCRSSSVSSPRCASSTSPGGKRFVDYAGSTVPITCEASGEITQAQILVATLGASNHTYAGAAPRQTTADWIGALVHSLQSIGGLPRLIAPEQTRAPIKAKVDGSVLLAKRRILACLRNRRFFSLGEFNVAIAELPVDLNNRPFKKLPGCRHSAFKLLDAAALRPLPIARCVVGRRKTAKVNIDYDKLRAAALANDITAMPPGYRIEGAIAIEEYVKGQGSIVVGASLTMSFMFTLQMLQAHSVSCAMLVFLMAPPGIGGVAAAGSTVRFRRARWHDRSDGHSHAQLGEPDRPDRPD